MPSIVDVAKLAGVSVTTVSRVINNSSHPLNSETRDRVLNAASQLNFVPSALARALVSDSTRIIGIIVGDASDPYFAAIVRGISDVARENGYLTMVCNSDRVSQMELSYVRLMSNYHVDGLIFAGGGLNDDDYLGEMRQLIDGLKERNIPVIILGSHRFQAHQISIDNVQAAMDMTEYLIGLGHRRIGFIQGPEVLSTSILRLKGYRQALEKHNIYYDPNLVVTSNFTYEDGPRVADLLLERKPRPTAIFGSNDLVTIGCLGRLRELGIAVPGEISLAGFDDISPARYVEPPLTTISVPMREMGATGMRHLLEMITSGVQFEEIHVLPYTLVERASCAPS